jgi:hypothetical protein
MAASFGFGGFVRASTKIFRERSVSFIRHFLTYGLTNISRRGVNAR